MKLLHTFLSLYCIVLYSLSYSQTTSFWGTSSYGGKSNGGVVFKVDSFGNKGSIVKDFSSEYDGGRPQKIKLLEASNGKLYGMTNEGGEFDGGVLFEYDPKLFTYIKKYDFKYAEGGYNPVGSLIEAENGKFYGLTSTGGDSSFGVLFEYNPLNEKYEVKVIFNSDSTGGKPRGALLEVNGKLYGLNSTGGANNSGTLFRYNYSTGEFVKLIDFNPTLTGSSPEGSLNQAKNGKLYGLCSDGGANNSGTLFEYSIPNNTILKKADFQQQPSLTQPAGFLIEGSTGKLFGTTARGGRNGSGGIFEYDIQMNSLTEKISFASGQGQSFLSLVNNKLIGTIDYNPMIENGYIFEYNLTKDTLIQLFKFDNTEKGRYPRGALTLTKSGELYGMTVTGGVEDQGVIYRLDTADFNYNKVLDFEYSPEGKSPTGALIYHGNGKLYGTTSRGGKEGNGVLFEYDPRIDKYLILHDFTGDSNGVFPQNSLLKASNGKLYGLCALGGSRDKGTLFEYNLENSTLKKLHSFQNHVGFDTKKANRALLEVGGILYGVTKGGINNDKGTLFKFDINTGVYEKLVDFNNLNLGSFPSSALTLANNGKIYGTTESGTGLFTTNGKLFEYDPNLDTIREKLTFESPVEGGSPIGRLVEINTGKLTGTTYFGGMNNAGTLYEYDYLNDTLIQLAAEFDGLTNGSRPQGSILEGSDESLYGTTRFGGSPNGGTLFCYYPNSDSLKKIIDFASFGALLPNEGLLEIDYCSTMNVGVKYQDSNLVAKISGASFQWLDCNNNYSKLLDKTARSFTPLDTGYFAVEITKNGCLDTSECIPVINVSVDEVDYLVKAVIFPNPFENYLKIQLNKPQPLKIEVFNITGKLIYQNNNQSKVSNHQINFNPKAGVYILRLTDKNFTNTFKLIKR